jgi:L-alanine-DL-glutamate epimerase-like enolase superfamily enzyme
MADDLIRAVDTSVYRVELPHTESDGTLSWNATVVVATRVRAGDGEGLGWTYGPAAAAGVIADVLAPVVRDLSPYDISRAHLRMRQATRNALTPGLASLALSAVDVALWDLKAKLLGVPLTRLLGTARPRVPLYGSGGFTSMTDHQLRDQLDRWLVADGMTAVKIKIGEDRGRHLARDLRRIHLARKIVGPDVALMVDANGGYETKQALRVARQADAAEITWFEEPVSSDRLADLSMLRATMPAEVTAGEYGTTSEYFERMCAAGAVDCLQVDATRCGGYTGALAAAAIADAHSLQVSTHCAPHLHAPVCAAIGNFRHAEYFADHARADALIFDGLPSPERGAFRISADRPGHGMTLRPEAQSRRIA